MYGIGALADSRPQKYFGCWNDCPISVEPTALPSTVTMLPAAAAGNSSRPSPVHTSGYTSPVRTVSRMNKTMSGRSNRRIPGDSVRSDYSTASVMSMSLMPTKGTAMPPTP